MRHPAKAHDHTKKARNFLSRHGYKLGGEAEDDREDRKIAAGAVHKHEHHMHKGEPLTKLKHGGHAGGHKAPQRLDKMARGGRAPKKVEVNVIVPHGAPHPGLPPPGAAPPHMGGPPITAPQPVGVPPGAGMGIRPGLPAGQPPMGLRPAGPLGFKRGGRTYRYPIDDGAGGGEGRLEKARAYGAKGK